MTSSADGKRIDQIMEQASDALRRCSYFEAERLALKALDRARSRDDFERMSRIVLPLQEARRQRIQQALDADDVVHVIESVPGDDEVLEPGCYLVQPPSVGADARRLRLAALRQEVPILVLCREPMTQLGQWPVVAITPGLTVRAKVDPPGNVERPDQAWYLAAMEYLGDDAMESIDLQLDPSRRVDALLDRLGAIPEHERLHLALREACEAALATASSP